MLQQKEAIRILEDTERRGHQIEPDIKRVRGGILVEDPDGSPEPRELMEVATKTQPTDEQWDDLLFAWRVVRHVRSNAIVLARDRATLGIGAGQMSRVDSVRLAIEKAKDARGPDAEQLLAGCVVASDAFFPFADGPAGGDRRRRDRGDPARRVEARRRGDRGVRRRRRGDGLHEAPPLPALAMRPPGLEPGPPA